MKTNKTYTLMGPGLSALIAAVVATLLTSLINLSRSLQNSGRFCCSI